MLKISKINKYGYSACIELKNKVASIVIEPTCGGRIVEYTHEGTNVIYMNHEEDGYLLKNGKPLSNLSPCGGRCDIGPEMMIPPHPELWLGEWEVIHADELGVVIRSKKDKVTGVQLERFFKLDENSSQLIFTQSIRNISKENKEYFHWSRTFAVGGGIVVAPLELPGRYPKAYLNYGPGDVINYLPDDDENIQIKEGHFIITDTPQKAKIALNAKEGWLAYITKSNLLFVKKFHIFKDCKYGEIAANNLSVWYNQHEMCELEPIGPLEYLKPDQESSFTEEWFLLPFDYHNFKTHLNVAKLREVIKGL